MGLIALGYLYWMRRVGYSPFQTVGGGAYGLLPKSRAWHAQLVFRGLPCWEASVTLYLWFQF